MKRYFALIILMLLTISSVAVDNVNKKQMLKEKINESFNFSTHISMASNVWTNLTNIGMFGMVNRQAPAFDWPGGSGNSYLWYGALWVAGYDSASVIHCTKPDDDEITITSDPDDKVRLSICSSPYFAVRPNVHESLKNMQVSDEDTYAEYTDIDKNMHYGGNSPLGIKIIERTYKWSDSLQNDFIIFDYQIINIGLDSNDDLKPDVHQTLDSIFVGMYMDGDVSSLSGDGHWYDDMVSFDLENHISYIYDADDPDSSGDDTGEYCLSTGYIGTKLLKASGGTPYTEFLIPGSHSWNDPSEDWWGSDDLIYRYMSSSYYALPTPSPMDSKYLQAVGPFILEVGDTINVVWANGVGDGLNSLRKTLAKAKQIYDNQYRTESNQNPRCPEEIYLFQNFPNPFNEETTIKFGLLNASDITLTIYNILGQQVKQFKRNYNAGYHEIQWNGLNQFNKQVASGVYIYKFRTDNFTKTKKCVFIK